MGNDWSARLSCHLDNDVDGSCRLVERLGHADVSRRPSRQRCESQKRAFGAAGMNCRERSLVTGVHGIEQRARFGSADFAEDDSIGPVPRPLKLST